VRGFGLGFVGFFSYFEKPECFHEIWLLSASQQKQNSKYKKTLKTLAQTEVLRTPEIALRAQPGSRKGVAHVGKQC